MEISRKQLIKEISDATGYTHYDLKEVFRVLQGIVYEHMKNLNSVRLFEGIILSGQISKGHMHHSNFSDDVFVDDHVVPKAYFTEGLRSYLRGTKEGLR